MGYVITDACVGTTTGACRDANGGFPCVESCPIDGIYARPGDPQLYAAADECIECADCYVACPVEAIVMDVDAEPGWYALNVAGQAH